MGHRNKSQANNWLLPLGVDVYHTHILCTLLLHGLSMVQSETLALLDPIVKILTFSTRDTLSTITGREQRGGRSCAGIGTKEGRTRKGENLESWLGAQECKQALIS